LLHIYQFKMRLRKNLVLLFIGILAVNVANAQKFKDKLKAAKEKMSSKLEDMSGNKDYSAEFDGVEFADMMTYVDAWNGKTIKSFNYDYRDLRYYFSEDVKVEVVKEGGEYKYIQLGQWKFVAEKNPDSDKIANFKGSPGALYISETKIVTYYGRSGEEGGVSIKRFYGTKEPAKKVEAEIVAYNAYTKNLINADVAVADAERARIAEEKAAARKAKYGLHDKDVKSIEVIAKVPSVFGYFIPFSYEVVATLKNGTKISTANGEGFLDDYIITKPKTSYEGALESGFLKSDELTITAKLKKNPSISHTEIISVPFNSDVRFEYYGKGWYHKRGDNGYDVTVKIKQEKHTVTGKPVLRVQINSNASYASLVEFSISPDKAIIIDCSGGDGGNEDGHFNGGNGGNIRVIKDPSVESFYINYDISGGKKGGYNASNGNDGRYTEQVQSLNF